MAKSGKPKDAGHEAIKQALEPVPNLLRNKTEIDPKFLLVEPEQYTVKTQHVTADAHDWVVTGRRVVDTLGQEMRLRGTEDDPRYKSLTAYFKAAEKGIYPIGNITTRGLSRTREIPTLCDALYPLYTPAIVNPFLVDLLSPLKEVRESELLGVLYRESRDADGFYSRPPLLCVWLK